MARKKTKYVCQDCGYESAKWMGKCPGCGNWNTLVEEVDSASLKGRHHLGVSQQAVSQPEKITAIESRKEPRVTTEMKEFNRVLGGGIVPGSLVLIGGDPGIGKSTLLLQISAQLADQNLSVLYISGEESTQQTKLRADRLNIKSEGLYVLAETNLFNIAKHIEQIKPDFVVIDSIQTIYREEITSAPGSVSQVRESTSELMKIAKTNGIPIFIVGHVTKEGAIAGPRMLEHMVDAVLYFEGERHHAYRILRSVKNRFGSTHEMGIFEMKELGLREVLNPSEIFLEERSQGAAGSTVVASMEGTRPVLVEIQALVSPSSFGNPRRMATGVDHSRVPLLMAVLEKRVGLMLQNQDAYIKVAGGVKLDEPAIDLAIAISIASSFRDQATLPEDIFIGEVGLTGEIRRVSRIEQRVQEAAKLGFQRVICPNRNLEGWTPPAGIKIVGVNTVQEAMEIGLAR
ncbi:DNA repair protein RadA like protein [Lentibacillus sp. JNUCC-1]|uniref:DNA repair protein RadA n=1 Tax=Lentibacillus sp. JNUCC-1 TaxID=2654513 RepID=UPI0012E7E574|nr:DNA repair protein RadA [Lentibacillus sp. JNUCC-1]MUV38058.1 DNA repair protein RadA like protein [Lentibacillus sp. JNUCC-1]